MEKLNVTKRTKIKRLPKRASYFKNDIYNILDDSFICQIGFNIDGHVNIIPTLYGRKDDIFFIHGSKNSRMLKSFSSGEDICVSVTIIDGLVLARSAFHHSVNYRSVILYGKPEEVTGKEEKSNALSIIMEHIIPGRWNEIRKPNDKELNATSVFSIRIDEASAKIREGGPVDEKDDLDLDIWAGVIPIKLKYYEPSKDINLKEGIFVPAYLENNLLYDDKTFINKNHIKE